jgi:hypothetical protein
VSGKKERINMADIELVIKMPKELYEAYKGRPPMLGDAGMDMIAQAIANATPLTPDILADLLMEERIRGELKQDISYSKDIIDDVRCRLTVDIIDHRPCYCGAELREV